MKRRSFLKMTGLLAGAPLIPKGKAMPQLGDLFAKLAMGEQLSSGEIEQLRLGMNRQQDISSSLAGLVNLDGSLNLDFLPIRVLYSKRFAVDTPSVKIPIPSDINTLMLFGSIRTDEADWWDGIKLIFNDDTGNNYEEQALFGQNQLEIAIQSRSQAFMGVGGGPGTSAAANFAGTFFSVIPNIRSNQLYKGQVSMMAGRYTAADNLVGTAGSWWENTGSIKNLTISPTAGSNFKTGSLFSVLGII